MGDKWYVGSQNDGLCIIDRPPSPAGTDVVWEGRKDLKHIACVDLTERGFEEGRKNANLIAAAPELLQAAKYAIRYLSGDRICHACNAIEQEPCDHDCPARILREAIGKAEGRS